jgi:hypothetical protein
MNPTPTPEANEKDSMELAALLERDNYDFRRFPMQIDYLKDSIFKRGWRARAALQAIRERKGK